MRVPTFLHSISLKSWFYLAFAGRISILAVRFRSPKNDWDLGCKWIRFSAIMLRQSKMRLIWSTIFGDDNQSWCWKNVFTKCWLSLGKQISCCEWSSFLQNVFRILWNSSESVQTVQAFIKTQFYVFFVRTNFPTNINCI